MEALGLDQVHIVVLNGDLTVQGADNAIGNGVGQGTQRVANGNGGLANSQAVAVADDRRGQTGGFDFQHCNVGGRILADDGGVIALVAAVSCTLTLVAPLTTWAQVRM